eukprot:COSAG02_NODE_7671_length_2901_cov_2.527123_4_plen_77_part_00
MVVGWRDDFHVHRVSRTANGRLAGLSKYEVVAEAPGLDLGLMPCCAAAYRSQCDCANVDVVIVENPVASLTRSARA